MVLLLKLLKTKFPQFFFVEGYKVVSDEMILNKHVSCH